MQDKSVALDSAILDEIRETRRNLSSARHLPGFLYTSPEIFDFEVDKIFMKEWLCVGRVEEFPNAGDYRAIRVAGEPLLVCRDDEGALQAFNNVCVHRGVEVATGEGTLKNFRCPYHSWVYDLQGKLLGAPHTKEVEGFDFENCGLPRVKLDTWGGYIFVNFDPDSESLADFLDEYDIRDFAAFLQPENTRLSDKYVFELPCNWKFIPENLMDMYHVGVIHKESFGGHFPVNDFRFRLKKNGYNAAYESFTMAPAGVTLFDTMPWLRGKVTDKFACTTWIRPTMNIFGRHDLIQPWVALPIDHQTTQITIYTQLPSEYFDAPAFEEKNKIYSDFIRLVADEDRAMLESLQNGVKSRSFRPGPTVRLERAIHHLLNYYLDKLLGEDDEARARRHQDCEDALRESGARNKTPRDGGYSALSSAAE
jgi:Rieske 2Fe-2S family protein